jgi:hypothetical protein
MYLISNENILFLCMPNDTGEYMVTKYIDYKISDIHQHIDNNLQMMTTIGSGKIHHVPTCQVISSELHIIARDIREEITTVPPSFFDNYSISELFNKINDKIEQENGKSN